MTESRRHITTPWSRKNRETASFTLANDGAGAAAGGGPAIDCSFAFCKLIGIELSRHRSGCFEETRQWGDEFSQFELIVALFPASQGQALGLAPHPPLTVQYWPILDPRTGLAETREAKLAASLQARDQIRAKMPERFGKPTEGERAQQTLAADAQ